MKEVLDAINDYTLPTSIVFTILTILMVLHLIILQAREVVEIRDYLTRYRYYILSFLVIFLLTMIPVAMYIIYRILGIDSEILRGLATLTGRFGPFCAGVALELIWWLKPRK